MGFFFFSHRFSSADGDGTSESNQGGDPCVQTETYVGGAGGFVGNNERCQLNSWQCASWSGANVSFAMSRWGIFLFFLNQLTNNNCLVLWRLAESLLHLLESDFVSVREAFDTKLLALSRVLTTNTERLKNVYSLLNNAAQNNTQTHDVLERMHALLQDYEVNVRIDAKTYIQVYPGGAFSRWYWCLSAPLSEPERDIYLRGQPGRGQSTFAERCR